MIFVASSHERISAYRGQSQTSPPAAWRKPSPRRIGGGQVNGYGNRAGIGYPCILHGIDGDSCRCGGQERPGMVRARGYAQRTRSPRSRRKNGASPHPSGWGRGTPAGSGIRRPAGRGLVEPAAEPNREGRETGLQAPIAAKEGGTAGQPPASLVPPAKPYRLGPATGDLADDDPGEAAHMPRPDETEAGVSQPTAPSASATPEKLPSAALPFPELPAVVDLPAIEREILARWRDGRVFERSLDQTSAGQPWTFYEGPPTANGMPGVHHVEARVFKDLFPRFKTMQGFHVPRQGGWDCHGLPVEVAVEQELGVSGKKEIEAYGIAEFNARCRESVLRHVDAFEALTERMGYWVDLRRAYRTMDSDFIESVWWSLKAVFEKGLLIRDYRISPYCPRCETPLSDHEMGQPDVYRTVSDPSVTVRFPLLTLPEGANPQLEGADLLVWTTTPWTLVSNTAVAVHPDETYAVARRSGHGDRVVVADSLFARVLGEGWHVVARIRGSELAGATYKPPFDLVHVPNAHVVVTGSFVTTEDGTGLVHLAPAFGADDMETGREHGLPVVNPIRPDGHFEDTVPLVGGMFFKDADPTLISDLDDR